MRGLAPGGKGMPGFPHPEYVQPKGERKMKRLMTLLLAAGLVLGATSAAKAVDFKMTGLWQNRVSFADRNFEKHNGDDKMRAATRHRTDRRDRFGIPEGRDVLEISRRTGARPPEAPPLSTDSNKNQGPLQLRGLDHSPGPTPRSHGPPALRQPSLHHRLPDPRRRRRGHHHQQPVHRQ